MDFNIRALTEVQFNLNMINTVFDLGNIRTHSGDFVCVNDNSTPWNPYENLRQAEDLAFNTGAVIKLRKATGEYVAVELATGLSQIAAAYIKHAPFVSMQVRAPDGRIFDEVLSPKALRCPVNVMAVIITCAFEQFAKELCAA